MTAGRTATCCVEIVFSKPYVAAMLDREGGPRALDTIEDMVHAAILQVITVENLPIKTDPPERL